MTPFTLLGVGWNQSFCFCYILFYVEYIESIIHENG